MGKRKGISAGRKSSSEARKKRRPKVTVSKLSPAAKEEEQDDEQYSFHSMLRNNHALPTAKVAKGGDSETIAAPILPPCASPPSPPQSEVGIDEEEDCARGYGRC